MLGTFLCKQTHRYVVLNHTEAKMTVFLRHLEYSTVECHLSKHVGTEGCSDNRNVRIIDGLTYDIMNS